MIKFAVENYVTELGRSPFSEWAETLKDLTVQRKIYQRIDRASLGNFGDYKAIKGVRGLFEMREHYGAGYRIFYSIINGKVIFLLAGSTKKDQNKTIKQAREYLRDYERRMKNEKTS